MKKSLEKKIEERKKEAKENKLFEKVETIAKFLGTYKDTTDHYGSDILESHEYVLKEGELKIRFAFWTWGRDTYMSEIKYQEQEVFEQRQGGENKINSYMPGTWEKQFNKLSRKAEKLRKIGQTKKDKEQEKKDLEYAAKFGL